jgi:inward rectifier potassium channel
MNLDDILQTRSVNDTGFDNSTGNSSGRVLNKDGTSNVIKSGLTYFKRISMFHTLIELPTFQFILLVNFIFILLNIGFALIYFILGPNALHMPPISSEADRFLHCFFFSTQTITTVGYGLISPSTPFCNFLASFEALFGWIAFAVLTGLIYGRFAKPKAYLLFSKNALITPHKNGHALMFRMAPYKNNNLTEAEVLINVSFRIYQNDKIVNKFLSLTPEIGKISSMALNWTIVHFIDEDSPLYGMCKEDFEINQTEIMVFVKAFDEHFSNVVQQRTSYWYDEIIHGAKFSQMFRQSDDQKTTVLELDKLDDYKLV